MLQQLFSTMVVMATITATSSISYAQAHGGQTTISANQQVVTESAQPKGIRAEVAGIALAIKEYYRDTNLRFEPKPEAWSGACSFWEITNLKLVSLKDNRAEVKASYIDRSYSLIGDKSIPNPPEKWGFRYEALRDSFATGGTPRIHTHDLKLEKKNGRWLVTSR
jgi:hypothetical protein